MIVYANLKMAVICVESAIRRHIMENKPEDCKYSQEEEVRIRKELQDAQQSGNKERMEKAWRDYMLLWKQRHKEEL